MQRRLFVSVLTAQARIDVCVNLCMSSVWSKMKSHSETEVLVGKTGSSVDQHLAAAIGLEYRIGHPDLFHVIDGLGRPFFGHRASQPKKTESSESSASSSSSSSVCSDGGQRAGQAEQADCSGQSSAREPAPPAPVLRTWSRLVRTVDRCLMSTA